MASRAMSMLRTSGLHLERDASRYLASQLEALDREQQSELISQIVEHLHSRRAAAAGSVTRDEIVKALEVIHKTGDDAELGKIHIVDPFAMPHMIFDNDKKKYVIDTTRKRAPNLLEAARWKLLMFEERYNLVQRKVAQHFQLQAGRSTTRIIGIGELLSCRPEEVVVVFGLLVSLKERVWHLEDPNSSIEVVGLEASDVPQCAVRSGIFYEGCFILAEGQNKGGVFHLHNICLPPVQEAKESREHFGTSDFFGGSLEQTPKASERTRAAEIDFQFDYYLILREVYVDDDRVLDVLSDLFRGLAANDGRLPYCVILLGRFVRPAQLCSNRPELPRLLAGMEEFGRRIRQFEQLCRQTHFIFVPTLDDVGIGAALPRPPLPEHFIDAFRRESDAQNVINAASPCRIRLATHEMVVVGEPLLSRMCQTAVRLPDSGEELGRHFARTLLSQSHLAPFLPHVLPCHWAWDMSLQLITLPDCIVFGDVFHKFEKLLDECHVINAGSFSRCNLDYVVYYPFQKKVEFFEMCEEAENFAEPPVVAAPVSPAPELKIPARAPAAQRDIEDFIPTPTRRGQQGT